MCIDFWFNYVKKVTLECKEIIKKDLRNNKLSFNKIEKDFIKLCEERGLKISYSQTFLKVYFYKEGL